MLSMKIGTPKSALQNLAGLGLQGWRQIGRVFLTAESAEIADSSIARR